MKIRILYMLTSIDGGGVGQILLTYLSRMDRERFECDVACLDISGRKLLYYDGFRAVTDNIYFLDKSYPKRLRRFASILKERRYHILHINLEEASSVYLLLGKLFGVKVRIAHSHLTTAPQTTGGRLKKLLRPLLYAVTTQKYACGEMAFRHMWGIAKSGHIMTNAIEVDRFRYNMADEAAVREEFGIPADNFIVGTVGRLSYQKNPPFIIEILHELKLRDPRFTFLWVGDGEQAASIQKRCKAEGLGGNVVFTGNRSDIPRLFNTMKVFILPSLYEGLPIVGVEAQASNLHCLFADTITREIGLTDRAEFLPIKSASVWADRISTLLHEDYDRTKNSGINDTKYDISEAVECLEAEYQQFYNEKYVKYK